MYYWVGVQPTQQVMIMSGLEDQKAKRLAGVLYERRICTYCRGSRIHTALISQPCICGAEKVEEVVKSQRQNKVFLEGFIRPIYFSDMLGGVIGRTIHAIPGSSVC